MNNLMDRLLKLTDKINTLKEKKARSEGRLSSEVEKMNKDYKCSTIEEAKELLKSLEKKQVEISENLEKEITELEEYFKAY